ncbi:MAG: glycosyltransferase family 4 protein [Candidatus Bathyarchaeia archaeon]
MNILFLSESFYPHGGGAEYATFLYAKLLSQAGFNITVITNKFSGEREFSKHEKLAIYRSDFLFSSFMENMIKWADIVYVPRFWFFAIPVAKKFGKVVITHLHDYIPICPLSVLYNEAMASACHSEHIFCSPSCIYSYEKFHGRRPREALSSVALNLSFGRFIPKLIALSDAVICVSKQQRAIIGQKGLLSKKLHIIYNPIPKNSIIGMEGDDFGYFGGFESLKGFKVLFQALLNIKSCGSLEIKVHSAKFNVANERLATALNKIGLLPYNKLERDALMSLYKLIRAVVVPSICPEPWPYVVVEALVYGRFVIASNIGGIPEQVEGCKGVKLFEAGNPCELADSIKFVSNLSRDEIVDLGMQNRETFLKRFDNESIIKGFINICEKLI